MIRLERAEGAPPLRIGHRGAAHLAPENTVRSLRAAVDHGVDLVEFDVLDLPKGPLVLAHSDHLDEVSHGMATGSVRSRTLEELREVAPELPTLDEAGLRGFESTTWQGLAVPAATPREIVGRLHAEAAKIVHSEDIRTRLVAMGTDPVGSTPEQFAAYVRSETAKWGKLIRAIGLRLE